MTSARKAADGPVFRLGYTLLTRRSSSLNSHITCGDTSGRLFRGLAIRITGMATAKIGIWNSTATQGGVR
jgi:hypothetical protein